MSTSTLSVSREWLLGLHFHIYTYSRRFRIVRDRRVSRRTAITAFSATNVLHVSKEFVNLTQMGGSPAANENFAKRAVSCLIQRGLIEVLEPGERIHWRSDCYLIVRRPRNRSPN